MEPFSMTEMVIDYLLLSFVFDPDNDYEERFSFFVTKCGIYIKLTIMWLSFINDVNQIFKPLFALGAGNGLYFPPASYSLAEGVLLPQKP